MNLYTAINLGLTHYHEGRFFDAHEVWEDVWIDEVGRNKETLQALIQIAAAMYKFEIGTVRGTSKLLAKALQKLQDISNGASAWLGFDLVGLRCHVKSALAQSDACARGTSTPVEPPPLPERVGPDGIVYAHGFASSPASKKAQFLVDAMKPTGISMKVPDMNEADFTALTLSRALSLLKRQLRDRTIMVGSSLGGYLAALLAARDDRIKALVLMAPALGFSTRLRTILGPKNIEAWRQRGYLEVDHYAYGEKRPIAYTFFEDGLRYPEFPRVQVPTYILQGIHDAVVPKETARALKERAPDCVTLEEVDDDHTLARHKDRVLKALKGHIHQLAFKKDS